MKTKVIFRADASVQIGYGHLIRSLALADMLKDNFNCVFATRFVTQYIEQEIKGICTEIIKLPETEEDLEFFLSLLTGDEIVVLDNYFFTTEYQQKIKDKGCKLVCIDDMHDKHYVADIVINHGVDDPSLFSVEPYTDLCLGIEWALLRKPFIEASSRNKSRTIKNIVTSFGGVDYHDITNRIIKKLKIQIPEIRIDAIVGGGYSGKIENSDTVRFHQSISAQEVAGLFSQCDLAILSTSTVCFEALACNARIAAGYYIDNQIDIWRYLKRINAIYDIGFLLDNEILADSSFLVPSLYKEKTINFKKIPCNYIKKLSTLKNQ